MTTTEVPLAQRSKRVRLIVGSVFLVVCVLVLVLATRPAANTKDIASPLVGHEAPPVSGTTLDGGHADLASYRGRYVVVNFFATWCVPCRQEHPEIKAFTERHPGTTAPAVLAVAYDQSDISAARSFFAKNGGDWPVVTDDGGRIAVDYGVRGLPESYVVDPQGNISAHITGAITANALDQLTGQVS